MQHVDARGCPVSGASTAALEAYEQAFSAFQDWRGDIDTPLAAAEREAPDFVMAQVLQAWRRAGSRDLRRVRSAEPLLARAAALPANLRERLHLAALRATLADDYEGARARLGELLRLWPRDALALLIAHQLDHLSGDPDALHARVAAVLPAWSPALPGYHALLAMHAFGLGETGEYERAEAVAQGVLARRPDDARSHHVMAHVFEMTERADAGAHWMEGHAAWHADTVVSTHCWWHLALFRLAQRRFDDALALYDQRVRHGHSLDMADLIDAAALLWRSELAGADAGPRWQELADAWVPHIDDAFCSFNDLHCMLAFVGARDWPRAHRLEAALQAAQGLATRYGEATRQIGLASCRALMAYGRGEHPLAITLLASLPALAHRFGGSHAQRDVLHLTLQKAVDRIRRPQRRAPGAMRPMLAGARL